MVGKTTTLAPNEVQTFLHGFTTSPDFNIKDPTHFFPSTEVLIAQASHQQDDMSPIDEINWRVEVEHSSESSDSEEQEMSDGEESDLDEDEHVPLERITEPVKDAVTFCTRPVPKHRKLHCFIVRKKGGLGSLFQDTYSAYIEQEDGNDRNSLAKKGILFCIAKQAPAKPRNYSIYAVDTHTTDISSSDSGSIPQSTTTMLGRKNAQDTVNSALRSHFMGRVRSNFLGSEFVLYNNGIKPSTARPPKTQVHVQPSQEEDVNSRLRKTRVSLHPASISTPTQTQHFSDSDYSDSDDFGNNEFPSTSNTHNVSPPESDDDETGFHPIGHHVFSESEPTPNPAKHRQAVNDEMFCPLEYHLREPVEAANGLLYDPLVRTMESNAISMQNERQQLCCVTYENNILSLKTPRKMNVLLPHVRNDLTKAMWSPNPPKEPGMIELFNNLAPGSYDTSSVGILRLFNKPPRWNPEMNSYVLNFLGRVTEPSVKNFQIVSSKSPEKVLLQFGKVDKNIFTMDIRYPITPLQAFAICISALVNKIACD